MIGGRVLDAAALIAFASRASVYAEALVWTAVDELTTTRARAVGAAGGDVLAAHALLCAADRGRPLVSGDAGRYANIPDGVEIEPLP